MKYICTHKCFALGRSIRPDEVVEISEAEAKLGVVKSSFKPLVEAPAPVAPAPKPDPNAITRDNMKARLVEWGVSFAGNISNEKLIELYDSQVKARTEG